LVQPVDSGKSKPSDSFAGGEPDCDCAHVDSGGCAHGDARCRIPVAAPSRYCHGHGYSCKPLRIADAKPHAERSTLFFSNAAAKQHRECNANVAAQQNGESDPHFHGKPHSECFAE
jgi:hypothetical protein